MSDSTGGHLRKQPCALLQDPAGAGAEAAQDAPPEVGQARQDRSHAIIHTMVMPGVRRCRTLLLLTAFPLLPSPALDQAVAPLHPGLVPSLKFMSSLDQPSRMWLHRVPRE